MAIVERIGRFVESERAQRAIAALILLNAAILGLETVTSIMDRVGPLLLAVDGAILAVFVVELLAKLVYRRLAFFRSGWNWFDLIVVGIALVPSGGPLSVLRALRVLRVLRLLSVVPSMRNVVEALLRALPGLGSVGALIFLIFYVGAVLTTNLFGATFPQWFGDIGGSMYSLFQIMTLESWSMGIVRPVMEVHPQAWLFFVPFILATTFAVLNLLVGIIVDAMQSQHKADQAVEAAQAHDERTAILAELAATREKLGELSGEIAGLRAAMARPDSGDGASGIRTP